MFTFLAECRQPFRSVLGGVPLAPLAAARVAHCWPAISALKPEFQPPRVLLADCERREPDDSTVSVGKLVESGSECKLLSSSWPDPRMRRGLAHDRRRGSTRACLCALARKRAEGHAAGAGAVPLRPNDKTYAGRAFGALALEARANQRGSRPSGGGLEAAPPEPGVDRWTEPHPKLGSRCVDR